jgi:hypothetical protein
MSLALGGLGINAVGAMFSMSSLEMEVELEMSHILEV